MTKLCMTKDDHIGQVNATEEDLDAQIGLLYSLKSYPDNIGDIAALEHLEKVDGKWTAVKLEPHINIKVQLSTAQLSILQPSIS